MIAGIAAVVLGLAACIYAFPLVVSIVVRSISPLWLLGSDESSRDSQVRCLAVATFLSGLADGIAFSDPGKTKRFFALTVFQKPFYIEGAYTGLVLAKYLSPWRSYKNADNFRRLHERFIFLMALGSGFAAGLKRVWSSSVGGKFRENFQDVDPKLQQMVFNGYGFQKMAFHYRRRPVILSQGLNLDALTRHGFYEGAGRALWFVTPRFEDFHAAISQLPGDCANDCYTGFGVATGFAGIETIAAGSLTSYPPEIRDNDSFRLGLVVGLFARYYTNPDFVEQLLATRLPDLLIQVRQAVALFDELWQKNVGYQEWKDAVSHELENPEALGARTVTTLG